MVTNNKIEHQIKISSSYLYKLLIYFAHSTLVIYDKSIMCFPTITVKQFRDYNPDLIQRVFDEGLSIFNYELSYEQMDRAILVYLMSKFNPKSVTETEIYKIENNGN